jgi:hypothetical protein
MEDRQPTQTGTTTSRPTPDNRRGGYPDVHGTGAGAGRHRPRRADGRSCARSLLPSANTGQDNPADPGAHADPPGLTRDRFAHTVSPRRSSQRSHAMSDRFLGAPMLVVGQMQGGHGQQARAGWVFDVVHVLMSAGRVAADGLVRLRRHLTRAGLHQRNGAVLASPPAWRPSCADAGHHDLDDHRHARGYAHGAGPAARTAIPAVSVPPCPPRCWPSAPCSRHTSRSPPSRDWCEPSILGDA